MSGSPPAVEHRRAKQHLLVLANSGLGSTLRSNAHTLHYCGRTEVVTAYWGNDEELGADDETMPGA